jgi:hypothetical protein
MLSPPFFCLKRPRIQLESNWTGLITGSILAITATPSAIAPRRRSQCYPYECVLLNSVISRLGLSPSGLRRGAVRIPLATENPCRNHI